VNAEVGSHGALHMFSCMQRKGGSRRGGTSMCGLTGRTPRFPTMAITWSLVDGPRGICCALALGIRICTAAF